MALGTPVTASTYGAPKTAGATTARQRVGGGAVLNAVGQPPRDNSGPRTMAPVTSPQAPPRDNSTPFAMAPVVGGAPSRNPNTTGYGGPSAGPGYGMGVMAGGNMGAGAGSLPGVVSAPYVTSAQQGFLDEAMARIRAQYDAYTGNFNAQKASIENMGDLERRRYQVDAGALQDSTGRQRALLGSDEYRTVGLGREQNDALIAQAHDLARRQDELLQKDWGYNQSQRGMAGKARDLALGYYDQVHGLALAGNEAKFDQGNRSAMSRAAATGSYMARGYGDTLSDNWGEKARGDQGAGASLAYNRGQAGQQYEGTISGLDNSWNQRDARYQQDRAEYGATIDKANRTSKYLDSLAADYGVRAGALDDSLRSGLARLGVDHGQAIEALNQAIISKDAGRMAQIDALYQQALSVSASAPAGARIPSMGAVGGNMGGASSGFSDLGTAGSINVNVDPAQRTYQSGGVRRT